MKAYISQKPGDWWKLPAKSETPLRTPYRPDLDVSPELKPSESAYFQSLIKNLRWIVDMGRIDICLEVSIMSPHLALPREGHLSHLIQVFSYLCKYHNSDIVLNPRELVIDASLFKRKYWTSSEFANINIK